MKEYVLVYYKPTHTRIFLPQVLFFATIEQARIVEAEMRKDRELTGNAFIFEKVETIYA